MELWQTAEVGSMQSASLPPRPFNPGLGFPNGSCHPPGLHCDLSKEFTKRQEAADNLFLAFLCQEAQLYSHLWAFSLPRFCSKSSPSAHQFLPISLSLTSACWPILRFSDLQHGKNISDPKGSTSLLNNNCTEIITGGWQGLEVFEAIFPPIPR